MINPKTPPVVLVTRPQQDAVALEAKLRERGFSPLLSPMLKITYLEGARTSLDGVQALIFTSANGVRSFFLEITLFHCLPIQSVKLLRLRHAPMAVYKLRVLAVM